MRSCIFVLAQRRVSCKNIEAGLESATRRTGQCAKPKDYDMSILASASKPADRAVMVTICGDSGMGKTSLAATFPKPIFIRAEDGLQAIPANQRPDALPLVSSGAILWEQLTALLQEEHDYKTVVIDSVTALERLFLADVLASDPKAKSINQALGGYGAGTSAVAAMHGRVRKACGLLNERKGMHAVFVAHADVQTMKLPDQDDYMRYSLRLPDKSLPPYVDDVDVVAFLRQQMFVTGGDDERKMARGTGARELVCNVSPANVSKNRYNITEPMAVKMGENPLADFIPALAGHNAPKKKDDTQ